jgi:outer membrane protein assembly factor BamE (lipoprotein component of BamABCDE complex)
MGICARFLFLGGGQVIPRRCIVKQILIAFICLVLVGCATTGTKIDQNKIGQIKEGVTTKEEVIALMGKPFMQNLTSDGKIVMMYQYAKIKNRAANFIPVVNVLSGGMDMKQQTFQVIIDKNDVVEKYIFTDTDSPINSGVFNTK